MLRARFWKREAQESIPPGWKSISGLLKRYTNFDSALSISAFTCPVCPLRTKSLYWSEVLVVAKIYRDRPTM